jgi:hypothetical protein
MVTEVEKHEVLVLPAADSKVAGYIIIGTTSG